MVMNQIHQRIQAISAKPRAQLESPPVLQVGEFFEKAYEVSAVCHCPLVWQLPGCRIRQMTGIRGVVDDSGIKDDRAVVRHGQPFGSSRKISPAGTGVF